MDEGVPPRLAEIVTANQPRSVRAQLGAAEIRGATKARWVGIYTVANGTVTNEAWSGSGKPAHPVFPATEGLTGHALRTQSIAVSNDVEHDPRYLLNQADSGSELIIPVIINGHVVGTLDIETEIVGAFNGEEITRYENLAAGLRPLWHPGQPDPAV